MWRCWNTSRTSPSPLCMHSCAVVAGHDAGGILAAMLQHRQRVIDLLIDR